MYVYMYMYVSVYVYMMQIATFYIIQLLAVYRKSSSVNQLYKLTGIQRLESIAMKFCSPDEAKGESIIYT